MLKRFVAGYAGQRSFVLFTALSIVAIDARAQPFANADALLAIDQHRASVVEGSSRRGDPRSPSRVKVFRSMSYVRGS